jgi:hypothetical protein
MRAFVLFLVVLAGLAAIAVSAYYLFQDWHALNVSYARFEELTMSAADQRSLFIADAHQSAFRLNSFADGVGVLLGAILAAIGLHGLCLLPRPASARKEKRG